MNGIRNKLHEAFNIDFDVSKNVRFSKNFQFFKKFIFLTKSFDSSSILHVRYLNSIFEWITLEWRTMIGLEMTKDRIGGQRTNQVTLF